MMGNYMIRQHGTSLEEWIHFAEQRLRSRYRRNVDLLYLCSYMSTEDGTIVKKMDNTSSSRFKEHYLDIYFLCQHLYPSDDKEEMIDDIWFVLLTIDITPLPLVGALGTSFIPYRSMGITAQKYRKNCRGTHGTSS